MIDQQYLDFLLSQPFKTSFKCHKRYEHVYGNVYLIFPEAAFAYSVFSYLSFKLDHEKVLITIQITEENKTIIYLKIEGEKRQIVMRSSSTNILEASLFTDGTIPYHSNVFLSCQYQNMTGTHDVTVLLNEERIPKRFLATVLYRYDNDGFQMPL